MGPPSSLPPPGPRRAAPEAWHATGAGETAARLGTDPGRGLEPGEAARRLRLRGPNRLPEAPRRSRFQVLLAQFANGLVLLLAGAALVLGVLGEPADAAAIAAILVLNGLLGYFQESRAVDALEALRRMTAPRARVRRGGRDSVVDAAGLVPGDLVILEAGDRVPADLRLLRASAFSCDEAPLTGESVPVEKDAGAVPVETTLAERRSMAWSGTTTATGSAEGVVVATGADTEFGRIAGLVREEESPETPLQRRLRSFGVGLGFACGGAVLVVFLLGLLRGIPVREMFLASVSLAVAAVPEGLPAVVTVTLALGVARMARRGALVRRLPAVETLGGTTVIASDKTGTLTTGEMAVRAVATAAEEVPASGADPVPSGAAREVLRAAAAGSTARLAGAGRVAGDPTEGAILAAAARAGIDPAGLDAEEPVASLRPFDAERRRMSVLRRRGGGVRVYCKGAPESVLPRCRAVLDGDGVRPLAEGERDGLEARNAAMAARGLRVLAVAVRDLSPGEEGDPEDGLAFAGFVGMADPPRPGARDAVRACREAGIRVVMVTGDQALTARAVAADLGIGEGEEDGEALAGTDIDAMTDAELARRVPSVSVVARAAPEHKLRIVRAWRRRGAVVAVTGDGVNDAPALQGADIGVAMGRGGTDVARDAAAMVLTDDDFGTIVAAVEEGRRIFANVRKVLLYLLSGNLGELLVMVVAVAAGWPLPLLPIQLLWVNLVTDGFPALALATDPAEPDVLRRPPRPPGREIADRSFLAAVAARGPLVAAATLAAFLLGWWGEGSEERARTYAFTTLVAGQIFVAFAFRSDTRTLPELGASSNLQLLAVAAGSLLLQFAVIRSEVLSGFLRTGPLDLRETVPLLLLGLVPVTVLEGGKLVRRALGAGQ